MTIYGHRPIHPLNNDSAFSANPAQSPLSLSLTLSLSAISCFIIPHPFPSATPNLKKPRRSWREKEVFLPPGARRNFINYWTSISSSQSSFSTYIASSTHAHTLSPLLPSQDSRLLLDRAPTGNRVVAPPFQPPDQLLRAPVVAPARRSSCLFWTSS